MKTARSFPSHELAASLVLASALCLAALWRSTAAEPAPPSGPRPILRHLVLVKFNDATPPEQIRALEEAMRSLPLSIPEIDGFECGTSVGGRGMDQGFTHANLFDFESAEALAAYQAHPAHQAFLAQARPHIEKLLIFDYWAEPGALASEPIAD